LNEFEHEVVLGEEEPAAETPTEEIPEKELPAEEPDKPEKPIKGPNAWTWLVAALAALFALMMLTPALLNMKLTFPAVAGLIYEAGRDYQSAMNSYEKLYNIDWDLSQIQNFGVSCGSFSFERQYAIWGRLYGPLFIVQNQNISLISEVFPERVPRSLRKLSEQCDILDDIFYGLDINIPERTEDQTDSQWMLAGLEATRSNDNAAESRRLYYECLTVHFSLSDIANGDNNLKADCLERLAALKADPAAEPWMYEELELYFAREDGDYETIFRVCGARLGRNREDLTAMQLRVKALFLNGQEDNAFAAAETYAKHPVAHDVMRLAQAELYYRQGKYDQAIALCDGILGQIDIAAPPNSPAEAERLRTAMDAVKTKGVVLLLQGKPGEARELLKGTWVRQPDQFHGEERPRREKPAVRPQDRAVQAGRL